MSALDLLYKLLEIQDIDISEPLNDLLLENNWAHMDHMLPWELTGVGSSSNLTPISFKIIHRQGINVYFSNCRSNSNGTFWSISVR